MLKQHRLLIPVLVFAAVLLAVAAGYFLSLPQGDELAASVRVMLADTTAGSPSKPGGPKSSEGPGGSGGLDGPGGPEGSNGPEGPGGQKGPEGAAQMGGVVGAGVGIPQDAAFTVTTGFPVKEEELRGLLEVEPAMSFQLSGGKKEWSLRPNLPLTDNAIYTFRVKNAGGQVIQSFAFQTRGDLLVGSVFPMDEEARVDVNTGIEVRFNQTGVDMSAGFEILPPVSGRFETRDYDCRFIPDAPLGYDSIYRITLKAGLRAPSGAALTEDYSFSFETVSKEEDSDLWGNLYADRGFHISYLPGDPMSVAINGGGDAIGGTYEMTLHKFPGINAYMKELRAHDAFYEERYGEKRDYVVATQGLDELMKFSEKLLPVDEYQGNAPLPENLTEGYYVFTLKGTDAKERPQFVQQLIQVVNLSLYSQSSDGDTLFWVNDPVTKGPVTGARLDLENGKGSEKHTGETEEDGRVRILTGSMEDAYLTIVREGTPVYFDRISLSPQAEEKPLQEKYYAALYTDRTLYRPGDLIHVWGVLKPRRITAPMPEEVSIDLGSWGSEAELARERLAVSPDGTFTGTLNPGNIRGDYYQISVTDGKNPYVTASLPIENYTKPAYEVTLTTDRELYAYNEEVRFSVEAAYYDGTPVAGGQLLVNCSEAGLSDTPLTLDDAGKGTVTGRLNPGELYNGAEVPSWNPQSVYWSVSNADGQDRTFYESAMFWAMPSKIAAKAETTAPGELTISTAVIDETKIGEEGPAFRGMYQDAFDTLKGVTADIPVTVIVHKTTLRQTQTGTVYDYANKKNIPAYTTSKEETIAKTVVATPVGGKVVVKDLPYTENPVAVPLAKVGDGTGTQAQAQGDDGSQVWYSYEVRFAGGVFGEVNVWQNNWRPTPRSGAEFAFLPGDNGFAVNERTVGLGEEVALGLYAADGSPLQNQGSVLYTLVQRGMLTSGIYGQGGQTISMEEDFLPNVYLAGAYFDGRYVYPVKRVNLRYDHTPKTLTVEAVPDQETYRPGDSLTVTLSVKDQEGKPVKAAAVVGVVDEAVFALAEQELNLADSLYLDVYAPSISVYTSTSVLPPDLRGPMNTGARMAKEEAGLTGADSANTGGGGAMEIRNLFADTAAFETLETDENGLAKVTMRLPDNITAWRITAAAVTGDLKAGDTTAERVATKPFYLQTIVTGTYLEGDDLSFSVKGVGDVTLSGDGGGQVKYTAVVKDGTGKEVDRMEKSGAPNAAVAFNLGKYDAGAYRVTLTGAFGTETDGVELPFTVTKTNLVVPTVKTMTLDQLSSLESAQYPVRVTVMEEQMKPCLDVLASLIGDNGERTEQIAASYAARTLYESLIPEKERETVPWDSRLDEIQTQGGVRLLSGGGPDPALTAKMLMSAPELIRVGDGAEFLQGVLKDASATPNDRVMAYVGLAAAKQPVLLDLTRMMTQEKDTLTPAEKLYLGAAFAKLGDYTTARTIYEELEPMVKNEGTFRYLEGDGTEESRRQTTAAALLLTSVSSHEDAPYLARFFLNQEASRRSRTDSVLCQLELLAFAKSFTPEILKASPRFTYNNLEGKTQDVTLEAKQPFSAAMSAQGLAKADFKAVSGKLYASVVCYEAPEAVAVSGSGGKLSVEKTYTPMAPDNSGKVTVGGKVKVTVTVKFDPSAPVGCYTLTDTIPAGLRYLSADGYYGRSYIGVVNDGQTVTANLYRSPPQEDASALEKEAETTPVPDGAEEIGVPAEEKSIPAVESADVQDETENEVTIVYYISAALPGSFITESAFVTPHVQELAARSGRGLIVVEE